MAAVQVEITYNDGRMETVRLNPRALVEAERHFKGDMRRIEGMMFAAWVRVGRPQTFDEWLDTIDAMGDTSVDTPPPPAPDHDSSPS